MSKPVILTGLRANNDLHIGNYFGALLPLIDMAKSRAGEYAINLFVPDLHSFTTPIDHSQLQSQIQHNLRLFVAAGLPLDHDDIHVYRQSYIPAHSELTWILDCFTGFGEMANMTQFKDKTGRIDLQEELRNVTESAIARSDQYGDNYGAKEAAESFTLILSTLDAYQRRMERETSVGLFNYPVLMAADILLYGATYVPVGEDQTQHLEFARNIAERLNEKFRQQGLDLVVPKPVKEQHEFFGKDQGLRIRDLQNPSKKMSKSDETGKGIIFLGDEPAAAAKKIMSAETDSLASIPDHLDYDQQPGISNLLQILSLLKSEPLGKTIQRYAGQQQYGPLKIETAEAVQSFLAEFQGKLNQVEEQTLIAKLMADEKALNEIANATLLNVQRAVGLRPADE